MKRWLLLSGLLMLGACSSAPYLPGAEGGLDRPVSERPTTSEAAAKARVHTELGMAYFENRSYGTALDEAKIAQAYDRNYAPGHLLAALVYASLEQHDLATRSFAEADRLAPGDPEINTAYGWYLCSRGRGAEGIVLLEKAIRNPYYRFPARAAANAGMCYLNMRDDVQAEQKFLRAAEVDGGNIQVLYHLAAIALRRDNPVRAREWMIRLQARMPAPTAETLWLALRVERKLGNQAAVADYAMRLRRDFPASDEYRNFQSGKFE